MKISHKPRIRRTKTYFVVCSLFNLGTAPENVLVHFGNLFLPFVSFYFLLLQFRHNFSEKCLVLLSEKGLGKDLAIFKLLICSLFLCLPTLFHLPLVNVQQVLAINSVNSFVGSDALLATVVLCQAKRL